MSAKDECLISWKTVNDLTHDIYVRLFWAWRIFRKPLLKKYANVTVGRCRLNHYVLRI